MALVREIRFAKRPQGAPAKECFELAEVDLPDPRPGQVQVRNLWMSVDPYMRGRMNELGPGYTSAFQLGAPLEGRAVGQVVASNDAALKAGDFVFSDLGWREAFNADPGVLRKLDLQGLAPEAFLGVAGMPGLTAYVGLMRIAPLKTGDIVLVTAAAGAVGTVAAQIAKLKGHTVIGSAGGPAKTRFLTEELGLDAAVDYHAHGGKLTEAFRAAAPDGIDVCFENVGGEHLEAAINVARQFGRFALCGMISQYNRTSDPYNVRNLMLLMGKELRLEGFIVRSHADMMDDFLRDIRGWIAEGKLKSHDTVFEGVENAPDAFLGLFTGENLGKALVRLS